MEKVYIGEISQDKISEFKQQHEHLHKMVSEEGVIAIVRRPTFKEIESGQSFLAQNKFISYNNYLFNLCVLALSKDVRSDEYVVNAFASQMMVLIETQRVDVEKL